MYGVSGIMNSIEFSFCHDFDRMAHGFRHDITTMYNGPIHSFKQWLLLCGCILLNKHPHFSSSRALLVKGLDRQNRRSRRSLAKLKALSKTSLQWPMKISGRKAGGAGLRLSFLTFFALPLRHKRSCKLINQDAPPPVTSMKNLPTILSNARASVRPEKFRILLARNACRFGRFYFFLSVKTFLIWQCILLEKIVVLYLSKSSLAPPWLCQQDKGRATIVVVTNFKVGPGVDVKTGTIKTKIHASILLLLFVAAYEKNVMQSYVRYAKEYTHV